MTCLAAVGYGYWGPNVVRNFTEMPNCRLKLVCDVDAGKLDKLQQRYPSVGVTSSFGDVLEDPEIQGVYIATPVSSHFELAEAALRAGKHVLIEKPLAANADQSERLCRLAEQQGLVLMVGHTFVYSPPVVLIRDLLRRGDLGDLYYIDSSRVNLGLFQKDVSVLWDLGPHDLSILLFWLGTMPLSIAAEGRSFVQDGLEDVAFLQLEFPDRVLAQVHVSWLAPSKLRRTTLVGSKQMVLYDDTELVEKVKVFDRGIDKVRNPESFGEFQLTYRSGDIVIPKIDNDEPLLLECQDFVRCIETGGQPASSGRFGLHVVTVVEAAQHSLRNGGARTPIPAV